jgi:hypothetical protein
MEHFWFTCNLQYLKINFSIPTSSLSKLLTWRDAPDFHALLLHRNSTLSPLPDVAQNFFLSFAVGGRQHRTFDTLVLHVDAVELAVWFSNVPGDFLRLKFSASRAPVELSRRPAVRAVHPVVLVVHISKGFYFNLF